MNCTAIACTAARFEFSGSLAFPHGHAVRSHVHALTLPVEKPARLHLGPVRRAAPVVVSQNLAGSLKRNFHFGSCSIHHAETGHFAGLLPNLFTQHVLRASFSP